jgi:RNA recognition motif-containing protein
MASIFVGKLDFNATEDQLKSLFEEFGSVTRITIGKDKETGKPKGFAFVEMPNDQEASQAVEHLDNTEINGRTMAVSIAENRGGTRPQNDNRSFDKNRGGDFKRNDRPNTDFKSEYKKLDEKPLKGPIVASEAEIIIPKKLPEKAKKEVEKVALKDGTKKKKMETYKKSGKANRFFVDDEDDEDLDFNYRRNDKGWDDDDEEE